MTSVRPILIKGGRVIDPSQGIDRVADVAIADGKLLGVDSAVDLEHAQIIDATGLIVCPGFIDLHTHLREPGFEYKETIATGTAAAARGGFTTVCAMPNTSPVMDSRSIVDFVLTKATEEGVVRVLPIGAVTKGSKGTELAEMGELAEAGAIGFSDDGHPVSDDNVMRQALGYASSLGLPIINHAEVTSLSSGGMMNEGWIATRLGLKGIPTSAEEIMVARDIELARLTGGRVHIAHASTKGTIDLVRRGKDDGVDVTCEVTPHHLTLPDETVMGHLSADGPFDDAHGVRLRLKREGRSSPAFARRRGGDGRSSERGCYRLHRHGPRAAWHRRQADHVRGRRQRNQQPRNVAWLGHVAATRRRGSLTRPHRKADSLTRRFPRTERCWHASRSGSEADVTIH